MEPQTLPTRTLPTRTPKIETSPVASPVEVASIPKTKFELAEDEPIIIDVSQEVFEKKGQDLISFVEKQICKMNESLLFDGSRQPSFFELNRALCSFEQVLLSLIVLYEDQRFLAKQAKELFDIWFAEKSITIRDRENLKDLAATKWLSSNEVERKVIVENKKEYSGHRASIILEESKESTLRRLIDGWNSYQFILSNLSKNAQAELGASMRGVDSDETTSLSSYN